MALDFQRFSEPRLVNTGAPFWSWNGRLQKDELLRQIAVMQTMGMSGFFMHSRTGLSTPYLGQEWFELIRVCAEEAKKRGMEAWLYDEDRWPSGSAGGMATADPAFQMKYLFALILDQNAFKAGAGDIAYFAAQFNGSRIKGVHRLQWLADDHKFNPAPRSYERLLIFRVRPMKQSSFYNGQTYLDTLKADATRNFIQLTHEVYKRECGQYFGREIKGIFTDEPHRGALMDPFGGEGNASVPWTEALPAQYAARFGGDLLADLPELFFQLNGKHLSRVKWQFVELLQELFLENFAVPIQDWCHDHQLLLTGHVLHEDNLAAQTAMQGSLMRFYAHMDIPGVDVLGENNRNYCIVKQLQSVGRQLGKPELLSELYGCTGWQMTFESYKYTGDWQTLLGITLRCHHLAWYTMEGEAKRDYPASISGQSAWYPEYAYLERYFARMSWLLRQGRSDCQILVINPIESVWCQVHVGWSSGLSAADPAIIRLDLGYKDILAQLMGWHFDFDIGDEDFLQSKGSVIVDKGETRLLIGNMSYRVVLVPPMDTIRHTTLSLLEEFRAAGGQLVFSTPIPFHVDAVRSSAVGSLASRSYMTSVRSNHLTSLLSGITPRILAVNSKRTGQAATQVIVMNRLLAADTESICLSVLNNTERYRAIELKLDYDLKVLAGRIGSDPFTDDLSLELWDMAQNTRAIVPAVISNNKLTAYYRLEQNATVALILQRRPTEGTKIISTPVLQPAGEITSPLAYRLDEPNICVLDAVSALFQPADGSPSFEMQGEILQVDRRLRQKLGLPFRGGSMVQPWFDSEQPSVLGRLTLTLSWDIEQMPAQIDLVMEHPEKWRFNINQQPISPAAAGWFVDPALVRLPIDKAWLQEGTNTLVLTADWTAHFDLEALYLIGAFAVQLPGGAKRVLTALPDRLNCRPLSGQGLPFYSGRVTYQIPAAMLENADTLELTSDYSALIKLKAPGDGPDKIMPWRPFRARFSDYLSDQGLSVEVVLTRRNTFGPLHLYPKISEFYGPDHFVSEGEHFSDDCQLIDDGLLAPPRLYRTLGI
ncbi:MAG: hypothetical protein VB070_05225 [Clostridiaceae bacterium]|nr:hypothetical protein [Clostridiaceae bacterium]